MQLVCKPAIMQTSYYAKQLLCKPGAPKLERVATQHLPGLVDPVACASRTEFLVRAFAANEALK